jgi:organic radical activating enzyme
MKTFQDTKDKLNSISPTFCLAKWKQVTVHLESGLTHSCHHCPAHIIPLDELRKNVGSLHNTKYKKSIRKDMFDGKVIDECEYCNSIEKNSKHFSDRIFKSDCNWAIDYFDEIVKNKWEYNPNPTYLEVSFSSVCNCSCIYCSPTFSSGWVKEIEKFGPYPTSCSTRSFSSSPIPEYMNKHENPYIDAFWEWFPKIYQGLYEFRITGGEPLLHKDFYKVLDYLIKNPNKNIRISINSNFTCKEKLFDKFINKIKKLDELGYKLDIYTSCEAYGSMAGYIRNGLEWDMLVNNCNRILNEVPNCHLLFMATYNILSITTFTKFLEFVYDLKIKNKARVYMDIPHLLSPPYLAANIITKDFLKYIEESVTFMFRNREFSNWSVLSHMGFYDFEIEKLIRIYRMVSAKPENIGCMKNRRDFRVFIDEYDRRYNRNFVEEYPEYKDFYDMCGDIKC